MTDKKEFDAWMTKIHSFVANAARSAEGMIESTLPGKLVGSRGRQVKSNDASNSDGVGSVEITVLDKNGGGIQGVALSIADASAKKQTDSQGLALIENVPGDRDVDIDIAFSAWGPESAISETRTIQVDSGACSRATYRYPIESRHPLVGSIQVTTLDGNGIAIQGVEISVPATGSKKKTDSKGVALIGGVPGDQDVEIDLLAKVHGISETRTIHVEIGSCAKEVYRYEIKQQLTNERPRELGEVIWGGQSRGPLWVIDGYEGLYDWKKLSNSGKGALQHMKTLDADHQAAKQAYEDAFESADEVRNNVDSIKEAEKSLIERRKNDRLFAKGMDDYLDKKDEALSKAEEIVGKQHDLNAALKQFEAAKIALIRYETEGKFASIRARKAELEQKIQNAKEAIRLIWDVGTEVLTMDVTGLVKRGTMATAGRMLEIRYKSELSELKKLVRSAAKEVKALQEAGLLLDIQIAESGVEKALDELDKHFRDLNRYMENLNRDRVRAADDLARSPETKAVAQMLAVRSKQHVRLETGKKACLRFQRSWSKIEKKMRGLANEYGRLTLTTTSRRLSEENGSSITKWCDWADEANDRCGAWLDWMQNKGVVELDRVDGLLNAAMKKH